MSADGIKALATAVLKRALRDRHREGFVDSTDLDFWCYVVGIEPAVVRSRCAAR